MEKWVAENNKIIIPKPIYTIMKFNERQEYPLSEESNFSDKATNDIINENLGFVFDDKQKSRKSFCNMLMEEDITENTVPRLTGSYIIESSPKLIKFKSVDSKNHKNSKRGELSKSNPIFVRPPTRCENPLIFDEHFK